MLNCLEKPLKHKFDGCVGAVNILDLIDIQNNMTRPNSTLLKSFEILSWNAVKLPRGLIIQLRPRHQQLNHSSAANMITLLAAGD